MEHNGRDLGRAFLWTDRAYQGVILALDTTGHMHLLECIPREPECKIDPNSVQYKTCVRWTNFHSPGSSKPESVGGTRTFPPCIEVRLDLLTCSALFTVNVICLPTRSLYTAFRTLFSTFQCID